MHFRMKLLAAAAVAILAAAPWANAQEWRGGGARIEGTVKNEKGEPIAGAKVSLRWGESGHGGPDLTTDKKGYWAFFGLSGGPWNIDISAPGYMTRKISTNLSEVGRNAPIKVELQPQPKAEPAHEEFMVGGKKISKEAAEAIDQGNKAFAAKNWAEARDAYLKVVAEMPDNEPLLMRIAASYDAMSDFDNALKYAKTASEKNPNDIYAWLLVAQIELQNGNLEAGKAALGKVPPEKITDPQPYLNMGIVLYNKKKPAEAEIAFGKAIDMKPEMADAYYYRGLARLAEKHGNDAKADFQKYLELEPNGSNAKDVKDLLTALQQSASPEPAPKKPSKKHSKKSH
jgi:Flp pilus assembly protein TadD